MVNETRLGVMDKWDKFLQHYKSYGALSRARDVAGISLAEFRDKISTDVDFVDLLTEAENIFNDSIRESFVHRGVHGYLEPVIYKGEMQYLKDEFDEYVLDDNLNKIPLTVRKFSDTMAIALAKAKLPEFKDKDEGIKPINVIINENSSNEIIDKFKIDDLGIEDRKKIRQIFSKMLENNKSENHV